MMPFLVRGLGDASTTQLAETGISTAGIATQTGLLIGEQTGAIASGSALASAIPFVGPIVAGVSLLVGWLLNRNSQYQAQESATTKDANQVEQAMIANLAAYQSCQIDQATALANFDALWAELVKACQTPQLGSPGTRCVTDRQAGACTWKNDGKGGPAGSGDVCWNWFVGYRDPIANTSPACAAASGMIGASLSPLLWAAAGGALLLAGSQS